MDFLDKIINNTDDPEGSNLNLDDFKIPEYEGIQTSLMKNTAGNSRGFSNGNNSKGFGGGGTQGSLSALNRKQDSRLNHIENEVDNLMNYEQFKPVKMGGLPS